MALSPENIEATIQGTVSGQIAVGRYILQVGAVHGGVVNIAPPEKQPTLRALPTPISLRPRRFPNLLDREVEVSAITAALSSGLPVEISGVAGVGKTTLLRHVAYHPQADSFRDGIVYYAARFQSPADLCQFLFDTFYESDAPLKPTEAQIRRALQNKHVLILLDDVELSREDIEELMNAAPGSTFLLASPERRLWGEVRALALHGLPEGEALTLVQRELDRPLTPEEQSAAQALCAAVNGHPLHLLQMAAMAREQGLSVADLAREVQSAGPNQVVMMRAVEPCPEPQRRVLAVLTALGGVALLAGQAAAMTGLSDLEPILEALLQKRLVQAHGARYRVADTVVEAVQRAWDLTPWGDRALRYFTTWAQQQGAVSRHLWEERDAILQALQWGVKAGRWKDVLELGRAVEDALVLGRHWDAWAHVLQWELQAARALGDQAAEAWALHQLGARALCLEDVSTALPSLQEALRLRERLGDRSGAAVTRHNLELISPPPPVRRSRWRRTGMILALLLLLCGVGSGYVWLRSSRVGGSSSPNPLPPSEQPHQERDLTETQPRTPLDTTPVTPPRKQEPETPAASTPPDVTPRTPAARLSESTLNFGDQEVNTASRARTATLTNTGSAPLSIRSVAVTGAHARDFAIAENECSNDPVIPGHGCGIKVDFTPGASGGREAELTISSNLPGGPQRVRLRGTGTPQLSPAVTFSLRDIDFGAQEVGTQSEMQALELTNSGSGPLLIRHIALADPPTEDFRLTDRCSGAPLAPGDTCVIRVSFAPTSGGDFSTKLRVDDNAADSPHGVSLHGTGKIPTVLAASVYPQELDFGKREVGTRSKEQNVTLMNNGTGPLTIHGVAFTKGSLRDFTIVDDQCSGRTLSPSQSCAIRVVFAARDVEERRAQLRISDDAPDGPQVVTLYGIGIGRQAEKTPASSPSLDTGAILDTLGRIINDPGSSPSHSRTGNSPSSTSSSGWCCRQGSVYESSEADCQDRQGAFAPTQKMAIAQCQQTESLGYCCQKGDVFKSSEKECRAVQGSFSLDRQELLTQCQTVGKTVRPKGEIPPPP